MTRIDLLTALGNVDSKHILEAKERAENHDVQSADDKGTVDIMSGNSFWKKAAPIAAIAASQILLFGVLIFVLSGNNRIEKDNSSNAQNQNTAVTTTVVTTDTEIDVIEEPLGTVTIEGLEIQLPCSYADLAIYPAYDEAKWLAPQESEFVDGMYDQQIGFKINEESNQLYTLWSTYSDGEGYESGTVYCVLHSEEGVSLTYNDESFVCGETTSEELTAKLGTQYTLNESGSIHNYTYKDGVVTAYFRDDKLDFLMIRSTAYAENSEGDTSDDGDDLPSDSTSYSENRTVEMMPYREGDLLYFGATVTVNQPHECDFELIVNVMDLNKGDEGLGENIPGLFQTVTKQSVSYGETVTLKAAIDYNEIPDNISVMCTVITYEYVGGEEEMPVETHQLLYPQTYSKYGDVFNGDIVTDNNDLPDEALEFSETVEIHRTIQSEYGDNEIVPIEPYRADGYLYVGAYAICRTYLHTDFELSVTVYDLDNGGTEVSELADTFKDEALIYGIKDFLRIQYDYDTFPENAEIHFEIMAYNSEDDTLYEQTEFTLEYSKENSE